MLTSLRALVRALVLALLPLPALAGETWYDDYDEAAAVAVETDRHLLVDFTGSDWCHWCIRLENEVFSQEAFEAAVGERFVLVRLDFPRDPALKAAVPDPARNQELFDAFRATGYPTVALVTGAGDLFARTGYRAGGPQVYVAHLDELVEEGLAALSQIQAAVAAYEAAEGEAKDAALDVLLARLAAEPEDSAFVGALLAPARAALEGGTAAQKARALDALIEVGAVDRGVLAAARAMDPRNEAGLWFDALAAHLSGLRSVEGVQHALLEMDAFTDAGLEVPEVDAGEFYFLAAYNYDVIGAPRPEGQSEEEHAAANLARAKRYARLARPLLRDPQRLALLDRLLAR